MFNLFIPRTWRLPRVVWALMVIELPFTVANLALFGIASPNLYRTILWREGGALGFNSDPTTIIYAYANYRPVNIPLVWSSFNTQYHLVIGVVCMFFYLVKSTLWLLHVFVPMVSLVLHTAFVILWAYGIHIQTSPDTIDPRRRNTGAPWYITKSCNVVENKTNRTYCMQAKSAFAVSIIMMTIYALNLLIAIYSLIPTSAQRSTHAAHVAEKKAAKQEKWATSSPYDNEMTAEEQWQHMWELQQLPRTPGFGPAGAGFGGAGGGAGGMGGMRTPMTPRTRAFNDLGGGGGGDEGASRMSRAWQGKYGPGQGQGTYVSPVLEQDEFYDEGRRRSVSFAR